MHLESTSSVVMSVNTESKRIVPSAANISLNPCAAPDWSTVLVSEFRIWKSWSTSPGKFFSPSFPTMLPIAFAEIARASGTASTRISCRPGKKTGR